jgi:5-methylcytosine-specific restriction endonuclease McrA
MLKLAFPVWNPQRATLVKMDSLDFKIRLKAARNSSSSFIKKEDVRSLVFARDGHMCVLCNSTDNLQIDHKVSVYACAKNSDYSNLNSFENLRTLCGSCNAGINPEELSNG